MGNTPDDTDEFIRPLVHVDLANGVVLFPGNLSAPIEHWVDEDGDFWNEPIEDAIVVIVKDPNSPLFFSIDVQSAHPRIIH